MTLRNIIQKTDEYLQVPSVVSFEHYFMKYLMKEFSAIGMDVSRERGLVVVSKNPKNPKVITAHIDRHGLFINNDKKFEFAAFASKKHYGEEIKASEALFKKSAMRFIDEKVYAYGENGERFEDGKVKDFEYDFDKKNLFFTIKGIGETAPSVPLSYVSRLKETETELSSQIDNVISVAVAYQLAKDGFDGKILFAAEEEIGRSWMHIANYLQKEGVATQELITLDTTPYTDSRAIHEGLIVLRNKDQNAEYNPELVGKLRAACESNGMRYEMKDEVIEASNAKLPKGEKPKKLGSTELGRIAQHTEGRYNGATVQLPTTNYHTNHETTSKKALGNFYQALQKIL